MKKGSNLKAVVSSGIRLVPGIIVVALAVQLSPWRQPDGWLEPADWAVVIVGLSLMIIGGTWRTVWQPSGQWLGLALVGHACALQLVFAPPYGVYQRYYPLDELLSASKAPFVVGIVVQTILILVVARCVWPSIKDRLGTLMSRRQLVLVLGAMVFIQVLLIKDVGQYLLAVGLTFWIGIVNVLNLLFVAMAVPDGSLERLSKWTSEKLHLGGRGGTSARPWDRIFPWMLATWVTVVSGSLAWFVFEGVPHIPDSMSYLFQAKYFSTGRLYLPAPPDAASFQVSHLVNDGTKWFAYGFPGWPAVLAIGVLAGVPWMVNPVVGGFSVLATHALLKRLYGLRLAHLGVALLAVSPWFLFTSASFMAHSIAVVWGILAMLGVENERRSGKGYWGALAGISLGALFLTRPLEALLVGSAIGLWALGVGGARLSLRGMAGMIVAGAIVASVIFPYNDTLTGSPLYAPHMKWTDEEWYPGADRLGFGPNIGNVGWPHYDPLPGHGPPDIVLNANKNLYASNFELFGWSFGSLVFVILAMFFWRIARQDWVFVGIIVAVVLGHSFYWSPGGSDFGARYWYQLIVPLIVLTIRGVEAISDRIAGDTHANRIGMRAATFVALACVVAVVNVVPWRSLGKYHGYRGMSRQIDSLANQHGFGHSLVFVRPTEKNDYASAFVFNPPSLDKNGTIYAIDAGSEQRATLAQHFRDRPVWLIGRARTNASMRVLAGPLPSPATMPISTSRRLPITSADPIH